MSFLNRKIDKKILWIILLLSISLFFFYPKPCDRYDGRTKSWCKCIGYERERPGDTAMVGLEPYGVSSVCYGIPLPNGGYIIGPN